MSYTSTYQAHLLDNLTAGQKAVITAIATFERNGKAWPSVATLAKRASMGIRTVQRHLAALINLGYITRTYRAGHAAVTRLFIGPTPAKLAPPPLPNWHPEPGISESVNQIPAAPEPATTEQQHQHASIAVSPPFISDIEQPKQPEPQHQAITEIEQPSISTNEAIYKPVEPSKEVEGTDPPTGTDKASEADPLAEVPATNTEHQADQAEAPATEADPAMAEWAKVDPEVLLSLIEIRKFKKKAPPTKTEVKHWYSIALESGFSLAQIVYVMVLRGWGGGIADASWLQHVPRPQMTATGAPAAPAAPALWTPDQNHIPASPATVATWREKIAQMKQRWREEPLKARPMRQ